ncbi:cell wall-binding repeat-containing protein [Tissierella creatinophila]|uniref:N-acetylmuramoyl-L-alanine amidase LytC n=1 Tax=Tissierella creatinophila DSM 6911 TaxID=1123403 RepID=A0A1U7M4N7_TISCR|nr:cell wall-binding repeat-containing protein [Tissierella creatinophila]OLS02261.1 N-acetylmuramoyl-L-alanine amidase LytC precursor [Tissierella creatinophila DSM 6911]
MKKYSKFFAVLLAIAMVLPGIAQAAPVAEEVKVERLAGSDRVETSIKVSQKAYDKADTVVLAGYNGEADALTGTLLANAKKAPLLLTYKDKLDTKLVAELNRLGAKNVYILGGDTVVFPAVETALKDAGFKPTRLKGNTRVETAIAIANEVLGSTTPAEAFVVEYNALADALAVGSVSAMKNAPILITYKNDVPAKTVEAVKAMQLKKATIVGGVVSDKGKAELEKSIATVNVVAGSNREETALKVAKEFVTSPKAVVMANGYKYADALVGGYFAAMHNAPMLLSQATKVNTEVLDYVKAAHVNTFVLGGETVVNKVVFDKVVDAVKGEVKDELKLESVSAIGAKKLEVKFNKALDTSKAVFGVKRGTIPVNTDKIEFAEDKMSATITTTTNLTKGDYTVSVTGLTNEALTGTVTVENEKVSKINVGPKAPRLTNNNKKALVSYEVLNQYGEKMIGQTINWTISTGEAASAGTADKSFEITAANSADFVPGAKVYITGVHAASGTVVNTEVEIVLAAQASVVEFKGVYNTTKGEITNLPAGFDNNKYVLLLKVKDQYGNKIDSPTLSDLLFTSNNPGFVDPTSFSAGSDVTINNVTYKSVNLVAGTMAAKGGKVTIQAISKLTGVASSYLIDAEAKAMVKSFSISAPAKMIAEKEKVEIPFTALDQYGNVVTKYDDLNGNVTLSPAFAAGTGLKFTKQNDGSAKLEYTAPATGATETTDLPVYLTSLVTEGGNFSSLMLSVREEARPTTILGLDTKKTQSIAAGNSMEILGTDLVIQDQYGREMTKKAKEDWLGATTNVNRIVVTSEKPDSGDVSPFEVESTYSGQNSDGKVRQIDTNTDKFTIKAKTPTTGLNKTEKLVFALSTDSGSTTINASAKSLTFTSVGQSLYSSYEVEDLGTMYNNKTTDSATDPKFNKTLKVYGVLANGTKVLLPSGDYNVTTNAGDNLKVTNNVISDPSSGGYVAADFLDDNNKAKNIKVNVLVTVKDGSGAAAAILEKELVVSSKAPEVTTITLDTEEVTDGKAVVNPASGGAIDATLLKSVLDEVKDQYGVAIVENPTITITKLVKVEGSSLTVNSNGTTSTSIATAKMGDKFTATFKYGSGKAVAVDFTVGIATP